ncbi:MAG: 3-keto-disaccharide hydrolase [Sphingobacteriaceae bacterium]
MKRFYYSNILFAFASLVVCTPCFSQQKNSWTPLFNGKDLKGWDTYLRSPSDVGYADETIPPYMPSYGLNNDPLKVFTVKDGLLHISGEVWGAITTKKEYSNYQLRLETKWGQKKYAPKDNSLRDGGILFHCTDGFDFGFKCWMRSLEMQIQETEIGDFFNVGGGQGDAEFQFTPNVATGNNEIANQYNPNEPLIRQGGRIYRSGNFETPDNGWTTSELIARGADAVFIVNGFVVNRLFNFYRQDLQQQVTRGKLQFQSEGAEHYYRKIEIRPLSFIHSFPKLVSKQKEIMVGKDEAQKIEIINEGEPVEIIAAELIGKNIDHYVVKLPPLPFVWKTGVPILFPVSIKHGLEPGNQVTLRLETMLGPVADFEVTLTAK